MSVAACLVGAPIIATVTSTQAVAQARQSGVLTQAEAVQFSNKLGQTLPDAIKAGYLTPAEVPGTYVITSAGASAAGVPVAGTLTPLQITALVAGALGLVFVTIDFLDDDDGDGTPPTTPPTNPPTTGTTTSQTGGGNPGTGTR